ncbi:MAG: GAF domain-containing protein, partial [Ginsengibacter sp.]
MEDNRGVMYFGIQNGIMEYDGVKWRKVIFEHTPFITRSMAKDAKGKVYYGDVGDFGYLAMDSLGRTVARSLIQYVPKEFRNFFDIWSIQVAREGIYFQSREYIFRLNQRNEMKVWKPKVKFLYSFYLDNNFYVQEQGLGLFKMVDDSLKLIQGSEFLGQERMQVMLPYSSPGKDSSAGVKQYLIGLFYSGLYLFDGKTFRPFNSEASSIFKISTLYKGVITQDGHYALSTTGKGLIVIDGTGKIVRQINRDVGLQDESVYAVYADSKGTLWLALDNGISRVETTSPLTQFTNQAGINTSALCIERFNGGLYLGTTNGLLKYNPANSHFDRINGLPSNQIFDFLRDGNTLLISNDGLYGIVGDKLINIKPSIGGNMALASLFISKKHPDVLYAGSGSGIKIFTRSKSSWKYSGQIPKVDDQIWTFSDNEDGKIWAGTQSGFVYRITPLFNGNEEPVPDKFQAEKLGIEHGLENAVGTTFKIKGETWFPADSCIYRFDDKQNRFVKDYTFGHFKNGGGYQEFYMIQDSMGRVWVRFGKETVLATPAANGKYILDTTSLLTISDQTVSSIYPESNGIVWFCTTDGLIRFDEKIKKNYTAPYKTILRHIAAGSEVLNPGLGRNTPRPPQLSNDQNSIRFEYAAPFFEQESKTQYQTWLEGFEVGWSPWDNNFYKEYTNLSPGRYRFHVRALNIYKKQSEEAVYEFIILPPWFSTWWAYTLYALIAILIIYALISWRTKALREKHTELEKTVEERTSQLRLRVEELAVINSVQEGLVKEMDLQGIYTLVGHKIREIFHAQVIDIVTYDKNKNLIEDKYAYEKGDPTLLGPRKAHGLRRHIIETKQALIINKDFKKINDQFDNEILIGEHPKSAVLVPMILAGEIIGMISLQDVDKENAFTESDISLLTTLANSMSVALENARLFEETNRLLKEMKQRNGELSVINSVQEGLVAQMSMEGIYMLVGDRIRDLFDAQTVVIRTYDYENQLEHYKYTIEKGERLYIASRPFDKFTNHQIRLRKPELINNHFVEYINEFSEEANLEGEVPKSALFVPMILGETVIGNLSLQNVDHENAFTESDISLLSTLANSMSVALENARLFDETTRLLKETEQRSAELSVINSVQEGLAKELHMQGIYELVGDKLSEVMNTLDIDIRLFSPETNQVFYPYLRDHGELMNVPPSPMGGMSKLVYQTRQTQVINEKLAERMAEIGSYSIPGTQMEKSFMAVPILVGNNILGMVSMSNYEKEHAFKDSDVRLLQTVVSAMSVALENARLFDETARLLKETEQKTSELAVINSVQDDLV